MINLNRIIKIKLKNRIIDIGKANNITIAILSYFFVIINYKLGNKN